MKLIPTCKKADSYLNIPKYGTKNHAISTTDLSSLKNYLIEINCHAW